MMGRQGDEETGRGIRCRGCGCRHFYVVRTRAAPRDRIMRTRECRHCGKQIVTYEAAAGNQPPAGLDELSPKQRETLLQRVMEMLGFRQP